MFLLCSFFFWVFLPTGSWGFDLTHHSVARAEISDSVLPKDAIPALSHPRLVFAQEAKDLAPYERVVGVEIGGEARAYPIRVLNGHEVVNDEVRGHPVAITW